MPKSQDSRPAPSPPPLEAVMVGAGNRGYYAYGAGALACPEKIRFTAVVEPHPERRRRFATAHRIEPARQLAEVEELFARGRLAEALFNCSPDDQHLQTTLPALAQGYHVMLEKPMATSLGDTLRLARAAEASGAFLSVGHVLRYTPFFSALHAILEEGELGDLVSVEHRENVSFWHMAHSFVRGNWGRAERSPMILAKCCHDLDLLTWNLGLARRLASFGSLQHFRREQAPAGAPARCTDGCPTEAECPFSAIRLYLGEETGWPVNVISEDLSLPARRRSLQSGPYGRCVYHCDNDVVDHQVVALEMQSGASATLIMHGHSHQEARTLRYDGTRATLRGRFSKRHGNELEVHRHHDGRLRRLCFESSQDGHGGGDAGLLRAFVEQVRGRQRGLTTASASVESHLLAFAAEEARLRGAVVSLADLRRRCTEKELV